MKWIRCTTCRARRPKSMPACPVCDGRAGAPPRFHEVERRERAAWERFWSQILIVEAAIGAVAALVVWLLSGGGGGVGG